MEGLVDAGGPVDRDFAGGGGGAEAEVDAGVARGGVAGGGGEVDLRADAHAVAVCL